MITLIKNTAFWYALAHMKTHLEPLAIATNFAQATFYCLDQILLTFRSLIAYYLKLPDVSDPGVQAIIASIEKQWDKADQEIFIAAVILNPFIKITPFNTSVSLFMNMGIFNLMKYLYTHFFKISESTTEFATNCTTLLNDVCTYLHGEHQFEGLDGYCKLVEDQAKEKGLTPDPVQIYTDLSNPNPKVLLPPLYKVMFAICPNLASCECLFSMFGNTLTKLWS